MVDFSEAAVARKLTHEVGAYAVPRPGEVLGLDRCASTTCGKVSPPLSRKPGRVPRSRQGDGALVSGVHVDRLHAPDDERVEETMRGLEARSAPDARQLSP